MFISKIGFRYRFAKLLIHSTRLCAVCVVIASSTTSMAQEPSLPPLPAEKPDDQSSVAPPEPLPESSIPIVTPSDAAVYSTAWTGPPDNLESLAVDITRRTVLAFDPKAGKNFMQTRDVSVRMQGHIVHVSATVVAVTRRGLLPFRRTPTTWEVSATLIYTPGFRRMIDLTVRQNGLVPYRDCPRLPQLLTAFNDEFDRQDPLNKPVWLVGDDPEFLPPRSKQWLRAPLQGDHAWHAFHADRYVEYPKD